MQLPTLAGSEPGVVGGGDQNLSALPHSGGDGLREQVFVASDDAHACACDRQDAAAGSCDVLPASEPEHRPLSSGHEVGLVDVVGDLAIDHRQDAVVQGLAAHRGSEKRGWARPERSTECGATRSGSLARIRGPGALGRGDPVGIGDLVEQTKELVGSVGSGRGAASIEGPRAWLDDRDHLGLASVCRKEPGCRNDGVEECCASCLLRAVEQRRAPCGPEPVEQRGTTQCRWPAESRNRHEPEGCGSRYHLDECTEGRRHQPSSAGRYRQWQLLGEAPTCDTEGDGARHGLKRERANKDDGGTAAGECGPCGRKPREHTGLGEHTEPQAPERIITRRALQRGGRKDCAHCQQQRADGGGWCGGPAEARTRRCEPSGGFHLASWHGRPGPTTLVCSDRG